MPACIKHTGFSIKARRRLVPITRHKPDKTTQKIIQDATAINIANILSSIKRLKPPTDDIQKRLQKNHCIQISAMLISERNEINREIGTLEDTNINTTDRAKNQEENNEDDQLNDDTPQMEEEDRTTEDETFRLQNLSIFERPPGIIISTNKYKTINKNVTFDETQLELLTDLQNGQEDHNFKNCKKARVVLFGIRDPPDRLLKMHRTYCSTMTPTKNDVPQKKPNIPGENGLDLVNHTDDIPKEENPEDNEKTKKDRDDMEEAMQDTITEGPVKPQLQMMTTPETQPKTTKTTPESDSGQSKPELLLNSPDIPKTKTRSIIYPQVTEKGYQEYFPKKVYLPAYAMNIDITEATLPFLPSWIGNPLTKETQATSLLDSGASFCFCADSKLKSLEDYTQYIKGYQDIDIQTGCDQVVSTKATIAEIPITFMDENANEHTVMVLFIVVDILSQEIFLGADFLFLYGLFKYFSTDHLMFNDTLTESSVKIPITWKRTAPSAKLLSIEETVIPPNSAVGIMAYSNTELPENTDLLISDLNDNIETKNNNEPQETKNIETINMIIKHSKDKRYRVILRNNSSNYLRFGKNEEVATITPSSVYNKHMTLKPFTEIHNLNHMNIDTNDDYGYEDQYQGDDYFSRDNPPLIVEDHITSRHSDRVKREDEIAWVKRKLDQDESMTEEERAASLKEFIETGKYQHSVTATINKNEKLSELTKPAGKWLTPQEVVDAIDITHIDKKYHAEIKEMFMRFHTTLSKNDHDIPEAKNYIADPVIKPEYLNKFMAVKYRPVNWNIKEEVQAILDSMIEAGILERTTEPAPFLSNLIIGTRKCGRPRILYDARPLNEAVITIPSVLTPKADIMYALGNSNFVSSLDLSSSYFQIPIHKDKRPLFTFCDTNGAFVRYCRAPQGYKNSSFHLSMLLNKALKGLEMTTSYYADDVYIHTKSKDFRAHLKAFEKVLERLKEFNLRIRSHKIALAPPVMDVLGYSLIKGAYHIPKLKVDALTKIKTLKSPDEVRTFVCTTHYFSEMIYDFWGKVEPLQRIQKTHGRPFVFTEEAKNAFEDIKNSIVNAIALNTANLDEPFYVSCDSSNVAAAALLYQVIDGKVKYLAATSRLYGKHEKAYSATKKEIMCILWALSKWDHMLRFSRKPVKIITDLKALCYIKCGKESSNVLFRISQQLGIYNAEVYHQAGCPIRKAKGQENDDDKGQKGRKKPTWLPDLLSRSITPEKLQNYAPISEKELQELLDLITIPQDMHVPPEMLQKYFNSPGLPSPKKPRQKRTTSKLIVTQENVKPPRKPTRKVYPPQLVKKHKFYPNQAEDVQRLKTDFSKPGSSVTTAEDENATIGSTQLPMKLANTTVIQSEYEDSDLNDNVNPASDENEYASEEELENDSGVEEDITEGKFSPITPFPTEKEMENYTYYRYEEDEIPSTVLNNIRLILDKASKTQDPDTGIDTERLEPEQENSDTREENNENNVTIQNEEDEDTEFDVQSKDMKYTNDSITETLILNSKMIRSGMITLHILLQAQETDPFISEIKEMNPLPKHYLLRDGFLLYSKKGDEKIVIPEKLMKVLEHSYHHSLYGRHNPVDKMESAISKYFYLPNLRARLKAVVDNCMICASMKSQGRILQKFGEKKLPTVCRQEFSLDLMDGFTESGDARYIAIFVELVSLYVILVGIKNKEAKTIVDILRDRVQSVFGPLSSIYIDNEPATYSGKFLDYCEKNDIQVRHCNAYSSFSNSTTELAVKECKNLIRCYRASTGLSHAELIPLVNLTMNNRQLTSSKLTPCQILFGNNSRPEFLHDYEDHNDLQTYTEHLKTHVEKLRTLQKEKREENSRKTREFQNRHRRNIEFSVDDVVYLKNHGIATNSGGSLTPKFIGPMTILTIEDNKRTCTVKDLATNALRRVHTIHLKKFNGTGEGMILPTKVETGNLLRKNKPRMTTTITRRPITRSMTTEDIIQRPERPDSI